MLQAGADTTELSVIRAANEKLWKRKLRPTENSSVKQRRAHLVQYCNYAIVAIHEQITHEKTTISRVLIQQAAAAAGTFALPKVGNS